MRRSARVTAKSAQAAEVGQEEEGGGGIQGSSLYREDSDNEDEQENQHQPTPSSSKQRGKKRKSASSQTKNQPPIKRPRGTRGLLNKILEMPLDVLVEIFGRLDPLDLLHLTWTTKDFRALLLTKNSNSHAIWKESFLNIPGIPECPEDLSEPKYAHLAFVNVCHKCNRKKSSVTIYWQARCRLCKTCAPGEFNIRGMDLPHLYYGLPPSYVNKSGRRYSLTYHDATVESWLKQFGKYPRRDDLVAMQRIKTHAQSCERWMATYKQQAMQEQASAIDARRVIVVEHLKKLGWEDEISKLTADDSRPEQLDAVTKACQKDLTARILSNLEPVLVQHMKMIKAKRLYAERLECLQKRLPVFYEVYQTYVDSLPTNSVYPGIADVFLHHDIKELVDLPADVDITSTNFDVLLPSPPNIFQDVLNRLEEEVLTLIPASYNPEGAINGEVLQLAAVTFTCKKLCTWTTHLRYPQVLVHRCARKGPSTISDQKPHELADDVVRDLQILEKVLPTSPVRWNTSCALEFDEEGFKILSDAMKMCGRDPSTTTHAELDMCMPVFECNTCHDEYSGRLVMPLDYLPVHKMRVHKDGEMTFCPLEERDAVVANARLHEDLQRQRASKTYRQMVCMHCKTTGNSVDLAKHAKHEHGISTVTEKDLAHQIDYTGILGEGITSYRMWPPREMHSSESSVTKK
ncbi:hypothetical protein D9613_003340 [Agrocybe pediades]|uniref:F-box domain-containing protein n=1 Tax=Agrocybe pediades TaxID=84607 RepID=A0A8H4QQ57_9AGAR|nr:hypothetical protein D9613_003340 [Agrocybe pediades]